MSVAFQALDIVFLAVVLISAIYATYRGFVAETLSIFAWVAAAFAALYFGPWAGYWLRGMVSPEWLGEAVGYVLVGLVVLLPLAFASYRIAENVKKSHVGTLDGAFGAAFGVLRGLALFGIAFLVFNHEVPPQHQPDWVTKARLLPVIRTSADVVASLIPNQKVHKDGTAPRQAAEKPPVKEKAAKPSKTPHTAAAKPAASKHAKKTYGAKDRQALDRLIETTDSSSGGKP